MRGSNGLMALGALAMLPVLIGPARASGMAPEPTSIAAGAAPAAAQTPPIRPMTDVEKVSAGCVVSSVGTMGVVYAIGPSEVVMVVVGGLVVPSSSAVLFVGLLSTIASMACAAAAAFTPAVLWGWRQMSSMEGGSQPAGVGAGSGVAISRPAGGRMKTGRSAEGGAVTV